MKILNAEQIRALDAYTIAHEPIAPDDLMERASVAWTHWLQGLYAAPRCVLVICGTGNNGGDGLCVARLLYQHRYDVRVVVIDNSNTPTPDFERNRQRLTRYSQIPFAIVRQAEQLAQTLDAPPHTLLIDALFGSGLNRPLSGLYAQVVMSINRHAGPILAIDLPSGLYSDRHTDSPYIVRATHTATFELPKLALLLPDTYSYVGQWHCIPIQLHPQAIEQADTPYYYLDRDPLLYPDEMPLINISPLDNKFAHKGTRGHALIIGGSKGKIGAAVLATRAAMQHGAGLTTACVPQCGYSVLQTAAPEAMTLSDARDKDYLSQLPRDLSVYRAVAIGVGLGQHPDTALMLYDLLRYAQTTTQATTWIFDADALNLIAAHHWQNLLPPNSILTPHPKEFERLAGTTKNHFERLEKLRYLAQEWQCYIALKGAHTAVACPNGTVFFNSTGNPAMATGGSGDVLTGMVAAYCAQGYTPKQALLTAVYRHGQAGDKALKASENSYLLASNLIH